MWGEMWRGEDIYFGLDIVYEDERVSVYNCQIGIIDESIIIITFVMLNVTIIFISLRSLDW